MAPSGGDLNHAALLERVHRVRGILGRGTTVAQLPKLALAPRPHLAVFCASTTQPPQKLTTTNEDTFSRLLWLPPAVSSQHAPDKARVC